MNMNTMNMHTNQQTSSLTPPPGPFAASLAAAEDELGAQVGGGCV